MSRSTAEGLALADRSSHTGTVKAAADQSERTSPVAASPAVL